MAETIRCLREMVMSPSDAEFTDAVEHSFIECYGMARTSSSRGTLRRYPDLVLFEEGVPSRWVNGVLLAKFTHENMAARVDSVISHFREKGLPITWYVGPSSTPSELGEYLIQVGLAADWELRGMALELSDIRGGEPPSGLTIHPVDDIGHLGTCIDVAARSYGFDDTVRPYFSDTYMNFGVSPTRRWFLGTVNGRPVATSLLVIHDGIAVVWMVATLKEMRGKGMGTAMTRETLLLAREIGHEFAVLHASESGLPVYQRMGFKEYCRIREYTSAPF